MPTEAAACSELTCSELGDFDNTYGESTVCGERDATSLGGSCSGALSWEAAKAFCEDAGARLCTSVEILDQESRGTGCSYDMEHLWSKTSCGGGSYLVAYGDPENTQNMGTATICVEESSTTYYAACCADTVGCTGM